MKIIGLTGGIGTGKSTASDYLIERGFSVLDADKIAREIVEPGAETLMKLTELYGTEILLDDGNLDRKKLGTIVFSDQEKKRTFDKIMHAKVLEIIRERILEMKASKCKLVFIDAPLLFETGLDAYANEVWVVDADDQTRINRIMKRDSLNQDEIKKRIESQMSREEKKLLANKIIDNCGSREELYVELEKLLQKI